MVEYKGIIYPSKNEIVFIKAGVATLRNVKQDKFFTVSEEDLPNVLMYTWHINANGYLHANVSKDLSRRKRGGMLLHQFIMGYSDVGYVIDHIDRVRTNNIRQNLRFVTDRGNAINHNKSGLSSRFLGLYNSKGLYFVAQFDNHHLCQSKDEVACALYYDKYVLSNYPEESTNFSLGKFSDEDLKRFGISVEADILNFKFNFKKLYFRFFGISLVKGKFQGRVFKGRSCKVFNTKAERNSVIKRELFLDVHPEWVTPKTKRNDLLSLFIPQPSQKFIIPKYIDENGNIKECVV